MAAKLTKVQRETVADFDRKINALQNQHSKDSGVIRKEQELQLAKTTWLFTDQAKPLNERKQKELSKVKALWDHELRVVNQRFNTMLTDVHKEFVGEFQKLETDCERAKAEISNRFELQLKDLENIFQAKLMNELQMPRDGIIHKAERAEKREEEERAKREAEAKAKKEAAAAAAAVPAVPVAAPAAPEAPKPAVSTPA